MTVPFSEFTRRATTFIAIVLFVHYAVFTIGYFFFPDFNDHYRFFKRPLLILAIPAIFVLSVAARDLRAHPAFPLVVAYMLYMVLSASWSTPFALYESGQKLTNAILILAFIVITHFLRLRYEHAFDRMLRLFVLIAAVSAVVSLFVFYRHHPFPVTRVIGAGSLYNINESSNVYAVFALLAMGYSLKASRFRERALYALPVICILCYIWFGQSRTAVVTLFFALLFLAITDSGRDRFKIAVSLVAIVGILLVAFPQIVERAWIRGTGTRPLIWQALLQDAANSPIFGQGITTHISYPIGGKTFETGHNAYLQALLQGGVIGLALLLSLIASALWHAWRLGREQGNYVILAILIFTMGAMVTGVDTLVARPRDQWMLFWFPLALLMSYQRTPLRVEER